LLLNTEFLVEHDHGPLAEGAASFHNTRWTIVMRAAQSQARGGQSALAELCRVYWYPLYIFARRRGHSPDDAQDLTQSFFLHLLEHRALTGLDRLKGKFRSFLLASFQNHLSDAVDHARWAMTVLREALKQLRHEYAAVGKTSTFEALKVFLDPNSSLAPPSYDEVANRLKVTTSAVKTLIHRLRSATPRCCDRRSAARCQIRQRLTRRSMLFARL
jgi:DNA-directed RNA polymerase specialized sigma24 family protein